ncbi:MAG: IclR family transcriptional regulator [Alphaproteobacteria bacterium]|nr:IclR family transcriptional regulator [Alphaproteobacteria bacterium]
MSGTVKSVAKVLDILEHLGHAGRPVGISDLARATSLHVSTAHRLLRTLSSRGYVEQRAESRRYALGPRVFELGNAYVSGRDFVTLARPRIEALRDRIGETVHLGVLSDGDVVEVCSALSQKPVGVSVRTGWRDPAHCSAVGKVILAHLPDEERKALLARRSLERRTARTITTHRELETELSRVRTQGYAVDDEELSDDLCCVAVPLLDGAGRAIAGMSAAMPKARFHSERIPELVRLLGEAARGLARQAEFAKD